MSNVGRLIYGGCNGFFGPEHTWPARIEAEGYDWLVVRRADALEEHEAEFASFESGATKTRLIADWASHKSWKQWSDGQV